jgi:hypothetical protein
MDALDAYFAFNAMAVLEWALAMLKERPITGALLWIVAVTIPAIIVDALLEWAVDRVMR